MEHEWRRNHPAVRRAERRADSRLTWGRAQPRPGRRRALPTSQRRSRCVVRRPAHDDSQQLILGCKRPLGRGRVEATESAPRRTRRAHLLLPTHRRHRQRLIPRVVAGAAVGTAVGAAIASAAFETGDEREGDLSVLFRLRVPGRCGGAAEQRHLRVHLRLSDTRGQKERALLLVRGATRARAGVGRRVEGKCAASVAVAAAA